MTFESDVAAISSRSIWVRARDRAESTGTVLSGILDYDGAAISAGRWDVTGPQVSTTSPPPRSTKSWYFNTSSPFSCGLVVMKGIVGLFASSSLSGTNPAMAFNGASDVNDFWANPGASLPAHVGAQFGTGFVSTGYYLWGRTDTPSQTPKDWTFQGSNDGSAWTTLDTRSGQTSPNGTHYTFSNATSYTYYRLNVSAVQSGNLVAISRIEIDGATYRTNHSGSSGEVWIVRKVTGSQSIGPNQTGTTAESYMPLSDGKVYYNVGSSARADNLTMSPAVTWTNWHILRMVKRSTGVMELWVDGVLKHSSNTGAASWASTLKLGGSTFTGASNDYHAEFIHFNAELSSGDVTKVTDYLTDTHISAVSPPATTGSGTATAPTPGAEGTGTSTATGSGSATAPTPTGSGSGTSTVTGSGDATAPAPGASGTGTSDDTSSGSGSATAPTPGAEGTGTSTVTGSGGATAPTPTTDGTGAATSTGSGEATAPTPGAQGTGVSGSILGSGSATAPVPGAQGAGDTVIVDVPGWDLELTGQCLLGVDTEETFYRVDPPIAPQPIGPVQVPLLRESHRMPRLTADNTGKLVGVVNPDPENPLEYELITEAVGFSHVWIDGEDRTYDDTGILVDIDEMIVEQGMGDQSATLDIRGIQIWDEPGEDDWSWLRAGADVETGFVREDGTVHYWWAGDLLDQNVTSNQRTFTNTWRAFGPLVGLRAIMHQPVDALDPIEMGTYLTGLLNGVIGRTYAKIRTPSAPRLSIPNANPGAIGETVDSHVRAILGKAWTADGRPWSLIPHQQRRRLHRLERVNIADTHWTYTAGAPGVVLNLNEDWTEVINCYWGRGVTKDGYRWLKRRFPYYLPYDAPSYFSLDEDEVLSLGSTDADTINNGVSLYQRRLQELGYKGVKVTGVFDQATEDATYRVQRDRGLQRDRTVGGQTWTAVWAVGSLAALLRAVRRPLAVDPRVEPYLYHVNGAIAGVNPAYEAGRPRRETEIDYGPRTSLAEGEDDAEERLKRTMEPALEGTMTLTSCPHEGTRWEIDASQNIKLLGYRRRDPFLHISQLVRSPKQGSVTVTVSTTFENALTVLERRKHNAESRRDPANRPGVYGRTASSTMLDSVTPFDGESPAGKITELTLRGGLWSVWPVHFDQVGTIQRVFAQTYSPASRFALQLFALPIQPVHLQMGLGNVLTQSRPWESPAVKAFLDKYGHIEGWGQSGNALGYESGREASGSTLNGIAEITAGVEYRMPKPIMWVGMLAEDSCRITVDLDPKPVA